MQILIVLFSLVGIITGIISAVMALINIYKNRPTSRKLAIISLVYNIIFIFGMLFATTILHIMPIAVSISLFIPLLPICILLILYLIGVKRYNQ